MFKSFEKRVENINSNCIFLSRKAYRVLFSILQVERSIHPGVAERYPITSLQRALAVNHKCFLRCLLVAKLARFSHRSFL